MNSTKVSGITNYINFDKIKFESFKICYNKAVENNLNEFEFEGNDYVVPFAKYLIEYFESKFN